MKRTLYYILCTLLLLSSFTACKDNGKTESQSGVSQASSVASVAQPEQDPVEETVQEDVAEKAEPVTSAQEKEEKAEAAEPAASATKQTEVKTEAKKTVTSVKETEKQSTTDEQNEAACKIQDPLPGFANETELKTWLLQGDGTFPEERLTLLNSLQSSNTVTYYRPNKMIAYDDYTMIGIGIGYDSKTIRFNFYRTEDLGTKTAWLSGSAVSVSMTKYDFFEEQYEFYKSRAESSQDTGYYVTTVNGIDYFHNTNKYGRIAVYWKQFGLAHEASFECAASNPGVHSLEELLPLLELEKVTLNANSDHVTQ